MNNKNENTTVAKTSNSMDLMGLKFNSVSEVMPLLELIAKSKNIGANTPADALAVLMQAQELGIGFGVASNHMHVVNGKSGIDIHIIKALLGKAGTSITWTLDKDYVPQYKYIAPNKVIYTDETLPSNARIVYNKEQLTKANEEGLLAVSPMMGADGQPIIYDYITEYTFQRQIRMMDGTIKTRESKGSFSYNESITAGLGLDRQGNQIPESPWTKYRKLMIRTRAFTYGARDIASDLLMGCYETSELYDINNVNYNVNKEGNVYDIPSEEVE